MHEIEFRGKGLLDGKWYYGFYYNMDDCRIGERRHIIRWANNGPGRQNIEEPIDPKTLGQYIGIKDIHGKKVYKGHIVKVRATIYTDCSRKEIHSTNEFVGEVVWHQYGWQIARKTVAGIAYHSLWLWNMNGENDDTMEILGDRWDNPEMAVINK